MGKRFTQIEVKLTDYDDDEPEDGALWSAGVRDTSAR